MPERPPLKNAAAALKRPYGGTPIDVLLYHYDLLRTGWNQSETDLTPTTVASSNFGQLTTLNVDGNVFAQPLLVSGFKMPDGTTHDVLIVVTGHDTVYAFDAQSYAKHALASARVSRVAARALAASESEASATSGAAFASAASAISAGESEARTEQAQRAMRHALAEYELRADWVAAGQSLGEALVS